VSNQSVKEMVQSALRVQSFEGLCRPGCGCGIDDIMPCCEDPSTCLAAYRWECKGCKDIDTCEYSHIDSGCYRTEKQA